MKAVIITREQKLPLVEFDVDVINGHVSASAVCAHQSKWEPEEKLSLNA